MQDRGRLFLGLETAVALGQGPGLVEHPTWAGALSRGGDPVDGKCLLRVTIDSLQATPLKFGAEVQDLQAGLKGCTCRHQSSTCSTD